MGRGQGNSVEIRGDTLRISFYFEGKRHRPVLKVADQPMKPTKANQLYAARLVEEIKARIKLHTFVLAEYFPESGEAGAITVTKQLDTWLTTQRIENSTKDGYTAAANFWKKSPFDETNLERKLGDVPLQQLKLSEILKAMAMRADLSGKTLKNYLSILRGALDLAVADKIITTNPAEKVPKPKWQKGPPDPFAADERDAIVAKFHERHPGQAANLVQLWMWTGLRTSELFGLSWDSVDLRSGEVVIHEALVRGEHKERTKTNQVRTVKLNSLALAAMKAQKAHTFMVGGRVFNDPRYGKSWDDERAFRRSFWAPVLKSLSMRYRRPYQMRHTYATSMLMAGMTPAFCAKQLGHSVEMFLRTYSKWIDGQATDRQMLLLEQSIAPPKSTKEQDHG